MTSAPPPTTSNPTSSDERGSAAAALSAGASSVGASARPASPLPDRLERLDPAGARALHALFDDDLPAPRLDEPLPPYWHWAALATPAPTRLIARDGHPARGWVGLPEDLPPRRMFAGGRLNMLGALPVGADIMRTSHVQAVRHTRGRSGPLVIVTTRQTLHLDGRVAATEEQDLVFMPGPDDPTTARLTERPSEPHAAARAGDGPDMTLEPAPYAEPLLVDQAGRDAGRTPSREARPGAERVPLLGPVTASAGAWASSFQADETALFRFSAATANAHRINYDRDFATKVEGHPDLVVHGPLLILALLELCRQAASCRTVDSVEFRAHNAAYVGQRLQLTAHAEPGSDPTRLSLTAALPDGQPAMTATVGHV